MNLALPDAMIRRLVRPEIRAIHAYHVPDSTGLIKLDAMENPYSWPAPLVDEWLTVLRNVSLNRYPDSGAQHLIHKLRDVMAVPDTMDLLLGNGSDELIQILALTLAGEGKVLLAPEPGFVMYRMIASFAGMKYQGVALKKDFSLDLPTMLNAIEQHQPVLVFLAYPKIQLAIYSMNWIFVA